MEFSINGEWWTMVFVPTYSQALWMGDHYTLGVTDLRTQMVYISDELYGQKLYDVIHHEMCHVAIASYGYSLDIPEEECFCQILEHRGREIQMIADEIYSYL